MIRIVEYLLLGAAVLLLGASCGKNEKTSRRAAQTSSASASASASADASADASAGVSADASSSVGGARAATPMSLSGGALLSEMPVMSAEAAAADAAARERKRDDAVAGKIYIEKVESAKINGMTSAELRVRVANTSRTEVTIDKISAVLLSGRSTVGTASCNTCITIPKRTSVSVTVPMSFSIGNLLTAYSALTKARRGELEGFTVNIDASASWNGKPHQLRAEAIPLEEVLSQAGVTADDVKNKINKVF